MGEGELVKRAQSGDADAFGALVERHQPRIYATLVKMTGEKELALDLTQDAFIRAWRQVRSFEGRSAFSTWLYRIAVRLAYDAMNRDRRRIGVDIDGQIADPDPTPEERAEVSALETDLRARIDDLSPIQRAVVVMRIYDDLPYREIAEALETTENSARVSFHHAIRRLRETYLEEAKTE